MNWSQHRKQLRSLLAPELRKRIDFHVTSYRPSTHHGEAWITVDGKRVFSAGYYKWENALEKEIVCTGEVRYPLYSPWFPSPPSFPRSAQNVSDRGIYETSFFLESLKEYLETPLKRALESTNPLIRAVAMLDRRLGRRRFATLKVQESDSEIVKLFYTLRAAIFKPAKA